MTPKKQRLTVTVDRELIDAGQRAVESGQAESVSGWVSATLEDMIWRDDKLTLLAASIADYEKEFGEITAEEIAQWHADRQGQPRHEPRATNNDVAMSAPGVTEGPVANEDDPVLTSILDVTADLLGEAGLDNLQLRAVAKRARVSLSTIYKHFPSRDALIVAAVERWMSQQVFEPLVPIGVDEPLGDALIRVFRGVVDPWTRDPTMLAVLMQALLLPGGERLSAQAEDAVHAFEYFEDYDPDFARDVVAVLTYLTHGLLALSARGRMDLSEAVRVYERAVIRLVEGHEPGPVRRH